MISNRQATAWTKTEWGAIVRVPVTCWLNASDLGATIVVFIHHCKQVLTRLCHEEQEIDDKAETKNFHFILFSLD